MFRALDAEISAEQSKELRVSGTGKLILYILNNKRNDIIRLEKASKSRISFYIDEEAGEDGFFLEAGEDRSDDATSPTALSVIDSEPYAVSQRSENDVSGHRKRWKEKVSQDTKDTKDARDGENVERTQENRRYKKSHRNRKPIGSDALDATPRDVISEEEDSFEENMASKREENYSLLKEIWRKIIK